MLVRCHHGGSYRGHGRSSSNIPDPKAGIEIELGGKKVDCRAYFGREEPTGWIYAANRLWRWLEIPHQDDKPPAFDFAINKMP